MKFVFIAKHRNVWPVETASNAVCTGSSG